MNLKSMNLKSMNLKSMNLKLVVFLYFLCFFVLVKSYFKKKIKADLITSFILLLMPTKVIVVNIVQP